MTTTGLTQPLTARVFLSGDSQGPDTVEVIASSLHELGVVGSAMQGARRLSTAALRTVHDEISKVADGFLALELGDILVTGWRKYTQLVDAAQRTAATPGTEEIVILVTHQVSSTYHPTIELLVDEVNVCTLVFELTVEFSLTGVVAVVQQGDLVALRGGECELTVTFALEGKPLLPQRRAHLDLALVVTLNPPVSLLRAARGRAL